MSLRIFNTEKMDAGQMEPYWPGIYRCLDTYCKKMGEETTDSIIKACSDGRRQLWIVIDENDQVVLAPVTEIREETDTGIKHLTLAQVGGKRLGECMVLLKEIEDWAVQNHNAVESSLVGRCTPKGTSGWARHLEPLGYSPKAVVFRKRIGNNG